MERCPVKGKVRNLVTLGGPNMGVSAIPGCGQKGLICSIINFIADQFVYFPLIQNLIGPAGYFRNPADIPDYLEYSVFLPYLNGEKKDSNYATLKNNFSSLNAALFVMFNEDTVIFPKETAWFWQLQADGSVLPVNQTAFYKDDLIGLRTLDEAGKVTYAAFDGNHLQFTDEQIKDVIAPFLKK